VRKAAISGTGGDNADIHKLQQITVPSRIDAKIMSAPAVSCRDTGAST
jgi:hypothetical protein